MRASSPKYVRPGEGGNAITVDSGSAGIAELPSVASIAPILPEETIRRGLDCHSDLDERMTILELAHS